MISWWCRKMGSSPHTRGAHYLPVVFAAVGRIIPAYAGSTRHAMMALAVASDHPRIRGEHELLTAKKLNDTGSSPHTRGAHVLGEEVREVDGIIPAYAGSTAVPPWRRSWPGDHPRIRGEHRAVPYGQTTEIGSSPHTRGARRLGCRGSA